MKRPVKLTRRDFIQQTAVASLALLAAQRSRAAESEARIEVLLEEPIGVISPDLYGHFTEHIGGVIYDGILVGEKSKVPNYGGIRAALWGAIQRFEPFLGWWPA